MFVTILLSLAGLSLSIFLFPKKWKPVVALLLVAMGAGVCLWTAGKVFLDGSVCTDAPSIPFLSGMLQVHIDGLSALFVTLVSVTAVAVAIYAVGYLRAYMDKPSMQISLHLFSFLMLYISIVMVVICRDAFGFLLFWELMTISSFVAMLLDPSSREVRKAALNYLVQMHIGFVLLLAGFVIVGGEDYSSGFDALGQWLGSRGNLPVLLLFIAGFGIKAGLFPVHGWLPEAHPAAPAHISAFMSGVMIKTGIYGILRVISLMADDHLTLGLILFIVGAVTALWGVIMAALQNEMKRLLAYSSMENMGIIVLAIGASMIGIGTDNSALAVLAMGGAVLHTINHSLFKSLLFFGVGNVYSMVHTTKMDELGGIFKRMPLTSLAVLAGVIAISALPPLNGFVSEFLIYSSFIETLGGNSADVIISISGIVILSLVGGVVILAFTKFYGISFLGEPRTRTIADATEVDRWRIIACALPMAGIFTIGLFPQVITGPVLSIADGLLPIAISGANYLKAESSSLGICIVGGMLLLLTVGLLIFRHYKLLGKPATESPTWGCGFSTPSTRMQYSGESFSEGLFGISTTLTSNTTDGEAVRKDEIFPGKHEYRLQHRDRITVMAHKWWLEIMRRITSRILRFNTGKVNHYILYALVFIVLVFLLTVTNLI